MTEKDVSSKEAKSPVLIQVKALPLGLMWLIAWMFTVGYAKLGFFSGVWALLVWPYYLGTTL